MVGGGETKCGVCERKKFSPEVGEEAGVAVGDNATWEPVKANNVIYE